MTASRRAATGLAIAGAVASGYWAVGLAVTSFGRRLLSSSVLSRGPGEVPRVALTFDDGPDPDYTERFAEALRGVPSTFFCLGERAQRWPGLVRELSQAGHEIACHGLTHRSLMSLGPAATVRSLRRSWAILAECAGTAPRYYRPAYGAFNLAAWREAPRLGMRRTLWSVWARDWEERATPRLVVRRVTAGLEAGAIVLLHDSDGSPGAPGRTLAALPEIVDGIRERGLTPVTLSELVGTGPLDRSS